jgi:hypothetical protein
MTESSPTRATLRQVSNMARRFSTGSSHRAKFSAARRPTIARWWAIERNHDRPDLTIPWIDFVILGMATFRDFEMLSGG